MAGDIVELPPAPAEPKADALPPRSESLDAGAVASAVEDIADDMAEGVEAPPRGLRRCVVYP